MDNAAAAVLDDQVTRCIALRDSGDINGATEALQAIVDVHSDHFRATLELLLVAASAGRSDLVEKILAGLPAELAAHPHIRLMVAYHYSHLGQLSEVMDWLSGVSHASVAAIPTFRSLHREMLESLANHSLQLTASIAQILPGAAMASARLAIAETILQHIVDTEDNPDELFAHIRRWTFLTPGILHMRVDLFGRMLARMPKRAHLELQSTAFCYLVATRLWPEARSMADRLLAQPDAAGDPVFAKALVGFATEGDRSLAETAAHVISECSRRAASSDRSVHRRSAAILNGIEVRARSMRRDLRPPEDFAAIGALAPTYSAKAADAGMHFYVGLFGQMRFGEYLLGPLAAYVEGQFAEFVRGGGRLSHGVATWEDGGQRKLLQDDGYTYLRDILPLPIADRLSDYKLATVGQAMPLIPNVVMKLLDEGGHAQKIDSKLLRSLFNADAFVSIENDDAYRAEFGDHLASVLGDSTPLTNQGRMWHRIAAHRTLVQQAEIKAGRPVTHVLLLRGDLTGLSGPLWQHIETRLNSSPENWAMFDHDPHASFIDGVGDRYMIMDRIAFDRIMDGYDLMRSIVTPGTTVDPAYLVRFFPHTHLRTILFEHGTCIYEVLRSSIQFDLYRGRRTIEQLRREIAQDAVESGDPDVAQFLASLVTP